MHNYLQVLIQYFLVIVFFSSVNTTIEVFADTQQTDVKQMRQWVLDMKKSPKGPFVRISWFCKDGTILPPEPYACRPHGGGIQHGEWNDQVKAMRIAGFSIANVLAALEIEPLVSTHVGLEKLKQILLEHFLINIDDGWIFRHARHYRGALQAEDEAAAARKIVEALLSHPGQMRQEYLLWRDAVRLLPRGQEKSLVMQVRQLSTDLAATDPAFDSLRNKIHTLPDEKDANRVRAYVKQHEPIISSREKYELLADSIDRLYKPTEIADKLRQLSSQVPVPAMVSRFRQGAEVLSNHMDPDTRFQESSSLLAYMRQSFKTLVRPDNKIALLDAGLLLEREAYAAGTALFQNLKFASRRQRLIWIEAAANALYGTGQMNDRQWAEVRNSISQLNQDLVSLDVYRAELRYLARVPAWVNRWFQFYYADAIARFSLLEPKTDRFIPERLRGGSLLVYTVVLDSLIRDVNHALGIRNELFDTPAGLGLRSLNPGIARGILRIPGESQSINQYGPNDIVLLPATTEKLSRVAGILTLGEGNALSHVQLLANNLGIPNVVIDRSLLPRLKSMQDKPVVLAVSPGGRVRLEQDGPVWDKVFHTTSVNDIDRIQVDLHKLNLTMRSPVRLDALRSSDAGRTVGPKAANLGELKYHFPQQVADGVAIPFGVFRTLLQQPMGTGDQTVFHWMQSEYRRLKLLSDPNKKQEETNRFLRILRNRIQQLRPDDTFVRQLHTGLQQVFGKDDSYTVFVRSDTNVEDLPGFTGAGLNLTVPNVRGFGKILSAISRVWASPFTERAYAWRQDHMDQPEHVYPSVLLMQTVPVEKSGVVLTMDLESGNQQWLTIAVNEGIGGAVAGQQAEELLVHLSTGSVRLLSEATASYRRVLGTDGGLQKKPVSSAVQVLDKNEIGKIISIVQRAKKAFPFRDDQGNPIPADIEFGFYQSRLALFQIRPFVRNRLASKNRYLNQLDAGLKQHAGEMITMDNIPAGVQ